MAADLGSEAIVMSTDVTDQAETERMALAALEECGALDVLVCNSGIASPTAPLVVTRPVRAACTPRTHTATGISRVHAVLTVVALADMRRVTDSRLLPRQC
jgi:NADP-dependent 3-hydroxy acid dehydrogenase YdfG